MRARLFDQKFIIAAIIVFTTILSCFLFSPWDRGGFGFDDGNFALAVESYSLEQSRPHMPGYYLHVKMVSAVTRILGNVFSALSFLSAFYTGASMGVLYLLLLRWFTKREALSIILFTATNPLVWFYGCNTEIYPFDLFFGITLVYLGVNSGWIYLLPSFMAFGGGVRPSSFVLLFPLYVILWLIYHKKTGIKWKKFILAHSAGSCVILMWLVPMLWSVGGILRFFTLYRTHNPMDEMTLPQSIYRLVSFNAHLIGSVIIVVVIRIIGSRQIKKAWNNDGAQQRKEIKIFVRLMFSWVVPPMLLFVCYVYSKGYMLLITAGISCLLFYLIQSSLLRKPVFITIAALQALYFIAVPYTLPDVDSYVALRHRKMGLLNTWVSRMKSKYLMSHSQYRHLIETDALLASLCRNIINRVDESIYNKKYLLIDPTCPLEARTLQVKHPEIQFAALDLHHEDCFFSYIGLEYGNEKGVKRLLKESVIFGRTDFIRNYGLEQIVYKKDYGEWSLYFYKDEAFLNESTPHESYFAY